ncbi:DUF3575 domain-containing protein [Algoriphagus formosus]|uniref:DUF3575 domain-containing protein n=1 Tax=Algoriphagus formosus TaxID=2007308 RepID=A0A4V3AR08_9BACT|nr:MULTISPECIES: DUF3575 domain-containing protein [Algoriphagus]TDK44797.1 DUF3575 domain-containing protein [Algoriphagus aquimaris]
MKNLTTLLLTLIFGFNAYSQTVVSSSSGNAFSGDRTNEIKLNFANLIALGSIEIGYEKFLSDDTALDFQLHINDRFGYNSQANGKNYKTNAVQAAMNFYFGTNPNGRFFLYPLAKIRFGEFEEPVDGGIATTNMNAFMIGVGAGFKWELSESFAFGPYVSIARGFSNEVADRFTRIELNGGFSLGYRF